MVWNRLRPQVSKSCWGNLAKKCHQKRSVAVLRFLSRILTVLSMTLTVMKVARFNVDY